MLSAQIEFEMINLVSWLPLSHGKDAKALLSPCLLAGVFLLCWGGLVTGESNNNRSNTNCLQSQPRHQKMIYTQ